MRFHSPQPKGDYMTDINDKKFREEQLKKVRNLQPAQPKVKPRPVPKMTVMRKVGRGR